MNRAQRQLRSKWFAAATVLCLLVVFDEFVEANASWLRWIAFGGMLIALSYEKRSRTELATQGSARMVELTESAPWLKVWFTFWAVAFLVGAAYVVRHSIDVIQVLGAKSLILAFAVLLGPVLILTERQRFKELGKGSDAT